MEGGGRKVVCTLQFACTDDVSPDISTAERLVRTAHTKGARVILIQEFLEGYYFCQAQREDFIKRAKPYKGHPTIMRMQQLAKELGVVLPISFFEDASNAHYNSIAVIDVDGTDLGLYRKSHIPDGPGYREKFYFNPGDTGFKGVYQRPERLNFRIFSSQPLATDCFVRNFVLVAFGNGDDGFSTPSTEILGLPYVGTGGFLKLPRRWSC